MAFPKSLTAALDPATLFRKVAPSVYAILAAASREQMLAKSEISQGSAVAVSEHDLITNCHVVEHAGFILVLQKDKVTEAKLLKASADSDRCSLKVTDELLLAVPGVRPYRRMC